MVKNWEDMLERMESSSLRALLGKNWSVWGRGRKVRRSEERFLKVFIEGTMGGERIKERD